MQLPWDEHFYEIVIPAWQAYLSAEHRLTGAIKSRNEEASRRAGYDALREGGARTCGNQNRTELRVILNTLTLTLFRKGLCIMPRNSFESGCGRH